MTGVTSTPPDGISRERLSSQGTLFYRSFYPFVTVSFSFAAVLPMAWGGWTTRDPMTLALIAFVPLFSVVVYFAWRGRRLCDVWLAGDALDVTGPHGTTHIPLACVHLIDGGSGWTNPRTVTCWLDRPVEGVREVRFIPRGSGWLGYPAFTFSGVDEPDELVSDLRARVARARSAQTLPSAVPSE
jgi:hypothetical protein